MDILNYVLAFIEGLALIVSPCILPILPIVLSGTLAGGKRQPIGIILGFTLFFALFSLLSGILVRHIGINLDLIRQISYGLIICFGIILISDKLSALFSHLTSSLANKSAASAESKKEPGFISGLIFGSLISLVWVPCGGPILAAAIVNMAIQKTFLASFVTFLFFALGSVLPMILIALIGKRMLNKMNFLKQHAQLLRKIFGVIIIVATLIAAMTGTSAAWIKPQASNPTAVVNNNKLLDALKAPYQAPALNPNAIWLNSPPLSMQDLKNKVVLIDFWTYSCINCIRTLPYLTDWYNKYHDKGLVIIGVHAPEFEFEKNIDNVKQALTQYHIRYPVVLDNDYTIWQNYNNQYWPAHYLINKQGQVVYQHFGEGDYDITEHNIQVLLGLNEPLAKQTPSNMNFSQTPETYLGYARAYNYQGQPDMLPNVETTYNYANRLNINSWSLNGSWLIKSDKIEATEKNTRIKIHFYAQKVYVVMNNPYKKPIEVQVFLNGQPVEDQNQAPFILNKANLYPLINLPQAESGELELRFTEPGAQLYTFTFG